MSHIHSRHRAWSRLVLIGAPESTYDFCENRLLFDRLVAVHQQVVQIVGQHSHHGHQALDAHRVSRPHSRSLFPAPNRVHELVGHVLFADIVQCWFGIQSSLQSLGCLHRNLPSCLTNRRIVLCCQSQEVVQCITIDETLAQNGLVDHLSVNVDRSRCWSEFSFVNPDTRAKRAVWIELFQTSWRFLHWRWRYKVSAHWRDLGADF